MCSVLRARPWPLTGALLLLAVLAGCRATIPSADSPLEPWRRVNADGERVRFALMAVVDGWHGTVVADDTSSGLITFSIDERELAPDTPGTVTFTVVHVADDRGPGRVVYVSAWDGGRRLQPGMDGAFWARLEEELGTAGGDHRGR